MHQVTISVVPSMQPVPRRVALSAAAMSRPIEGFSVIINLKVVCHFRLVLVRLLTDTNVDAIMTEQNVEDLGGELFRAVLSSFLPYT